MQNTEPQTIKTGSNTPTNVKRLVLTAVLIGLGTALSLIRIWQMPLGGEVTLLSMLPIALISIEYGVGWGFLGAFVYSLIRMMMELSMVFSWGLSPAAVVGTIILDYILAFTSLGLAGVFRKKGVVGICFGVALALLARFIFHLLSGTIIFGEWMPEGWANPFVYSVCYNGLFMLPELVLTTTGAVAVFKIPGFNKMVASNME